jgi:general secretion pathway protein D
LEDLLKDDPNNGEASRELGYLDDPIRTNPALTYEHTQNVDKVRRTLYTAEGNYNLGKFDESKHSYEEVLRIDPYNTAARRGMERIAQAKSDYYRAAYDHTRAELLAQVDAAWEISVPVNAPNPIETNRGPQGDTSGVQYITEKLKKIIIPKIDFEDTTVEEAIEFLRLRAAELDTLELDPAKKGVNFVIRRPKPVATPDAGIPADPTAQAAPAAADPGSGRIHELRVRNVPLAVALKYICEQTKLRYKVDDFAVTLVPQSESGQDIFTRTFSVPPDFAASLDSGDGGGGAGAASPDPFAGAAAAVGGTRGGLTARKPIIELLKQSGIAFPDGTSATLNSSGVLLVTNTPSELDKVEQLVNILINKQPKQVKITTKFVEISQENGEELGFDWIVTPFGPLGNNIFGAGGTIGNGTSRTGSDFTGPLIDGTPAGPLPVSNIVTAGDRSGDGAISRNSIDAVLNNPNRTAQKASVAPGIMSLTGLFSDGQVKMIMRGLSQKKGTDLMTAPSVTARSGQKATIEIIREFIYPSEYEPPQIPNSVGQNQQQGFNPVTGGQSSISSFPVTPATPTAFQTRNTGVTLEIEPTISDNNTTIDLRFVPEIVEFEGFINYGSPIQSGGTDLLGNPITVTITENRIEMPVFSARRVNTALTIYDGYTVALGGLMREDVQNVEDKVPILGDIPVIGRLFQTKAESHIKSNLIVFVSAQIIDATGRPLRGSDAAAPLPTVPAESGAGSGAPAPAGMTDPSLLPPL